MDQNATIKPGQGGMANLYADSPTRRLAVKVNRLLQLIVSLVNNGGTTITSCIQSLNKRTEAATKTLTKGSAWSKILIRSSSPLPPYFPRDCTPPLLCSPPTRPIDHAQPRQTSLLKHHDYGTKTTSQSSDHARTISCVI